MAFPIWKTSCTFSSYEASQEFPQPPGIWMSLTPVQSRSGEGWVSLFPSSFPALPRVPVSQCEPRNDWKDIASSIHAPSRGSLGRLLRSEKPFAPLCKMPVFSRQCRVPVPWALCGCSMLTDIIPHYLQQLLCLLVLLAWCFPGSLELGKMAACRGTMKLHLLQVLQEEPKALRDPAITFRL